LLQINKDHEIILPSFDLIKYFMARLRDDTVRITLWGHLAHSLNEDVVGKHTVVIVTSTMVEGLQGKLLF
jgi:hypothetical protein